MLLLIKHSVKTDVRFERRRKFATKLLLQLFLYPFKSHISSDRIFYQPQHFINNTLTATNSSLPMSGILTATRKTVTAPLTVTVRVKT